MPPHKNETNKNHKVSNLIDSFGYIKIYCKITRYDKNDGSLLIG